MSKSITFSHRHKTMLIFFCSVRHWFKQYLLRQFPTCVTVYNTYSSKKRERHNYTLYKISAIRCVRCYSCKAALGF